MASTRNHSSSHKRLRSRDLSSTEIAVAACDQQLITGTERPCCILLTGGTGFLGKAIIRELLNTHPTARLILVTRPKRGSSGETRVNKLIEELFPKNEVDGALQRTRLIQGDLQDAAFWTSGGLNQALHEITHIVHSAASVRFDDPLPEAIRMNVHPLLALHNFASTCGPQLCSMIHVSTAYVSASDQENAIPAKPVAPLSPWVMKVLKPLLINLNSMGHSCSPADASELQGAPAQYPNISSSLWEAVRGHHPNTYTFSKAVGEALLTKQHNAQRSRTFTLKIVRPSIISSALDPCARGNESFAALNAVVAAVCCGYLHAVNMCPNVQLNVVPVDRVARVVLHTSRLAASEQAAASRVGSDAKVHPDEVEIIHATSDSEHSIWIRELFAKGIPLINHTFPGMRSPSLTFFEKRTLQFRLLALLDCLPFMAISYFGWGPARRKARQALHALQSINDTDNGIGFFVKPYNLQPSEAAKQAGIVDYDVESYYTTITMAVMSSLEQKGIIRKLPRAQGSRLHRSTVRIFYHYVRSWFR